MALGIAVVALCVLSIASYAVVRAIEWASRHLGLRKNPSLMRCPWAWSRS